MSNTSRRSFLLAASATAVGSLWGGPLLAADGSNTKLVFKPEEGAKLNVLRWKPFVEGDNKLFNENTEKFTAQTGIPVKVDHVGWEDVRSKSALAARVGSGPDIIIGWFDDAQQIPDKLVQVDDLADHLGKTLGGWYPSCETYGTDNGKWIDIPLGVIGNAIVYRKSQVNAAGFDGIPTDLDGFLKMCQALKAKGTPAGFALGHAVGDANNFAHWLLWSHGGKMVNSKGEVTINSPETIAALEYAKQLYETFIPGTLGWNDVSNNKAYSDGQLSVTANGISLYYSLINSDNADLRALGEDTYTAHFPIGVSGEITELQQITTMMLFKYSKYQNAAKAYMQFMMEPNQYNPWLEAAIGYVCQPLKAYESNPVWSMPKVDTYKDTSAIMRPSGYDGPLGPASAAVMADYVLVDMFAAVASGSETPKKAVEQAEARAKRAYRS